MTDMPPPNVPEPPAPVAQPEMVAPPPPPPPAPAKQPSKLRTYLSIGVLLVIVGGVLYAIRNNQDANDVKAGTCFDFPSATDDDFSTVETKQCTEAHDAEAILVANYTDGDAFPISLSINRFFEEKCVPAAEAYVGLPFDSILDVEINLFGPTREAWDDGKRQFTCYAESGDGTKLTKSVKGGAAAS